MTITEVRIRRLPEAGRIKATASVTLDGCFAVHDIRIIQGQCGLLVTMPSRRLPGGDYLDIAHPINAETRDLLERAVLDAYEKGAPGCISGPG